MVSLSNHGRFRSNISEFTLRQAQGERFLEVPFNHFCPCSINALSLSSSFFSSSSVGSLAFFLMARFARFDLANLGYAICISGVKATEVAQPESVT